MHDGEIDDFKLVQNKSKRRKPKNNKSKDIKLIDNNDSETTITGYIF